MNEFTVMNSAFTTTAVYADSQRHAIMLFSVGIQIVLHLVIVLGVSFIMIAIASVVSRSFPLLVLFLCVCVFVPLVLIG